MSEATDTRVRGNSAPPVLRAVPTYAYSTLPESCIRLLQIMPHHDDDAPIRCQLFNYPLFGSSEGYHLYEALSYVWGPSETPRVVHINEACLAVTENLHMALSRLRNHSLPRIIWVDAICIDQSNLTERNSQVQFMAEIYESASRVIVWLEETTASGHTCRDGSADGDFALEAIRAAANESYLKSQKLTDPDDEYVEWVYWEESEEGHNVILPELCTSQTNRQRILVLLGRLWFRRIWVLQEVAAARHVSIISHSREIEGSTFCAGLEALDLTLEDKDVQNRIRSVAYLVRGATFRDRHLGSRAARFSLNIRSLEELVDMYHDRDATNPRDKVYALLGMCSDDEIPDGLCPDYSIEWRTLFHRLIQYLVGKQASAETWHGKQVAVIRSKFIILGKVSSVQTSNSWGDRQEINIKIKNRNGRFQEKNWPWALQASTVQIKEEDVICLLQGAKTHSILRIHEDYCSVVAIAVTPPVHLAHKGFHRKGTSPHDALILWDWEASRTNSDQATCRRYFEDNEIWTYTADEIRSDEVGRLETTGLILLDMGNENAAIEKLERVLDILERVQGRGSRDTVSAMKNLGMAYAVEGDFEKWQYARKLDAKLDILGRKGDCICTSEATLARFAESSHAEAMGLLLDYRGQEFKITEGMVEAAARNMINEGVMGLLLDRRGDQVTITEEVLKAAARNERHGSDIIALLLDRKGDEVTITKEVVRAAAINPSCSWLLPKLLFKGRKDQHMTEEFIKSM
ncbi:hypothetical protein PG996_011819, partial [Apiospora saccharicola]